MTRGRRFKLRIWPHGISGRVALVLMICLVTIGGVSLGAYINDRARATIRLFAESAAGRITSIVDLMDRTPAKLRRRLVPALNSPTLWLRLTDGRPLQIDSSWRRIPRLARMVEDHLPVLRNRITSVRAIKDPRDWGKRDRGRKDAQWLDGERIPDLMPSRQKLLISISLSDGSAVHFVVASDTTSLRWAVQIGFWLFLTVAVIILFSIWAGRRLTRPLRRFAAAADQLGLDVRAPPLPEQGSRELRRATGAFNQMQGRIRRLVDDRTMMLAAISHDLRTMLTRLRLRSEFIEDEEQQRKALVDVDDMQAMLESTLSFARSDTESEPRTDVDVAVLAQSLCHDLTDAGHKAEYQGPEHLVFRCGPVSIKRAVANLADNAIKYGGEVTVEMASRDGGLDIIVADRGPGIPVEIREKVFTPFYRAEPSRSRETGGTGLGLSVARSIVRRHGGNISLMDREGGGLIVTISIPAGQDAA